MQKIKIVIVGGVAGGASAAAKARRVNENAEIVMFEKGPFVSFANCGLPYYIGGAISDRKSLLLQSPGSFWTRFRVKVHVLHEVLKIDRATKTVTVVNLANGIKFIETYDKLVLAPGAGALVPPLPGINAKNIFTVKTVPDSDSIRNYIEVKNCRRAVVVGAGFIGLEAAEALQLRGLEVSVVELLPQVLPPFDADCARFVERHLEQKGIQLFLGDGLKAFHGSEYANEIELNSGRRLPLDFAILSIGVRPELRLAKEAGLEIGKAGGIAVDERQCTSDPDIFAAGDAVEVTNLVTGKKGRIPLAGPANKEGRVAGANAAGGSFKFPGAYGTAIVETMGVVAAKTGLSEREAKAAGLDSVSTLTHSANHAGYYPGAELMHIKIISDAKTGQLLGAQIIGEQGVDKRIDVLATALAAKMSVSDLENLDLAYAPQFSSAKDPVVMAGFVAANTFRGDMAVITCEEYQAKINKKEPLQLIDVRSQSEYDEGHLPNSILIPIDQLRDRLHELNSKLETVVYCRVGLRGYLAERILVQNGFNNVTNLTGGILMCENGREPKASAVVNSDGVVNATHYKNALDKKEGMFIDVSEVDEYRYEKIEGTSNIPLLQLVSELSSKNKEEPIFLMCKSGLRSLSGAQELKMIGFRSVYSMKGGLVSWKQAGYPTVKSKGPIPIMRQVQIVAGGLALIGGLFTSLRWIAVVVGAGLVFAGVSGLCGMATVLSRMPWNRKGTSPSTNGSSCGPRCG